MKTFSALLDLWEGNPPVTDGFPSQRPATGSFDVFFDLRLNKWLSTRYDITVMNSFEDQDSSPCKGNQHLSIQWNLNQNTNISIQENVSGKVAFIWF